jgi:hypothetical protein
MAGPPMVEINDTGATIVASGIRHLFFSRSKSLPSRACAVNGKNGKLIAVAVEADLRAACEIRLTCR